jgi:hypothetical protein
MAAIYLAPAGIDDFGQAKDPEAARQGWHAQVSSIIAQVQKGKRSSPLFYDQLADASGVPDSDPQGVPWNGFPLRLDKWYADSAPSSARRLANAAADTLLRGPDFGFFTDKAGQHAITLPFRVQDEYCEWFIDRTDDGAITRISFTCEPPEYWSYLASQDFDLVVKLYRTLLGTDAVQKADLQWATDVFDGGGNTVYQAGDYNPWNDWNTVRGAVHLTHPANSLFAEIQLASDSSLGWPVAPGPGAPIDAQALMCCAGVGGINRSSDPLILQGVYGFASQGKSVALFNPIGLYMNAFSLGGLLDPEGNPIQASAVKRIRQSTDGARVLRVEVTPPPGASYTLDQCTLDGEALAFGGQIARAITMRLFAVAKTIPGEKPRKVTSCPTFCCTYPPHPAFRGTFGAGQGRTCTNLGSDDWAAEFFDIPDAVAAEGAHAAMTEAALRRPRPRPRGRATGRGSALEIAFEDEK